MKSLLPILIGITLAVNLFGTQTLSAGFESDMHQVSSHEMASSECGPGACPLTADDCALHCFVASGFRVDAGMIPTSSLLWIVIVAVILTRLFTLPSTSLHLAFEPLGHTDPRLLLTTQKRE